MPNQPKESRQPLADVYDAPDLTRDDAKDCSGNRNTYEEDKHENVDQG